MPSLLPANRSALETALSLAIGPRLLDDALPLAGFKADPADDLVPWLIWEYGLDELLPYLPDPRQALREGILFQRLRGSEASLRMALGWVGYADAILEEAGPGPWWAQLQLDPGALPSDADVRRIVGVARLALPARAHLIRLYHGYDHRPLTLDAGPALDDGLLDDDSGIDANGVRLSFGRTITLSGVSGIPDVQTLGVQTVTALSSVYTDDAVLDWWRLDSEITLNHRVTVSSLYGCSGAGLSADPMTLGVRVIARADFVLDGTPLDCPTALFEPSVAVETGAPLTLDAERLDGYEHSLRRVPVDELAVRTVGLSALPGIAPSAALAIHWHITLTGAPEPTELVLDGDPPDRVGWRVAALSLTAGSGGPYRPLWPTARWSRRRWDEPVISVAVWTMPAIPVGPEDFPAWTITPWPWWDRPNVWAGGWTGGWLADLIPPSDSGE